MAKKEINIDEDLVNLSFSKLSHNMRKTERQEREPKKPFKKPQSDYLKIDLVKRGTDVDTRNYDRKKRGSDKIETITRSMTVQTEEIITDYRSYLDTVKGDMSIQGYIQKLIEDDMRKNGAL